MVVKIINIIFEVYMIFIIIYAVGSWFPQLREYRFYQLIEKVVEPPLSLLRKFIPPIGGIDITPAILIFILYAIQRLLISRL